MFFIFFFFYKTAEYEMRVKVKGIVHFEINFLNVLAYLKGIQDVQ